MCLTGGWGPSWRWDRRWPAGRRGCCCSGWRSLRGEQSPVRTDSHKYMRQRTEQNIKSPSDPEAIWSVPRKQKWFTLNRGRDRSWTSKRRESLCSYCSVWPPLWRTEWYSHYKERPSQPQICAQRGTRHFSPEFWLCSTKKHSHVGSNLKACIYTLRGRLIVTYCNIGLDAAPQTILDFRGSGRKETSKIRLFKSI